MQIRETLTSTEPAAGRGGLLYVRLASDLTAQMARGVLRPGERLPSVRALSRQRGVSISTVMQAYMSLERDGRVVARERSGYYVSAPEAAYPAPRSRPSLVAPAPVGIGEVVGQVLGRTEETRLVPLGVAAPARPCFPCDA